MDFFFAVDSGLVKRLIREGNEQLFEYAHPDPLIAHYMPGGSSFMRNPAIPLEVCFPDGIPEGYSKYVLLTTLWIYCLMYRTYDRRRVNIDFSNIPDDQEFADRAFVDSANKTYFIDK